MKRSRWIAPIVLVALAGAYWWLRPRPQKLPEAYLSERSAPLWSSLAQVRQPVTTVRYGEKVVVLDRKGEQALVRTSQGVKGWIEARLLMDAALWQRSERLLAEARAMPVQASGLTKVASNLRSEPGRGAARVYQFIRGTPVEVLSRAVIESSASSEEPEAEQKSRREDWFFVRGLTTSGPGSGGGETMAGKGEEPVPVAGWVLARFIELDLPDGVRDYVSSAGLRVVAWFELNRVPDAQGEKPQYLVAGVRGGEGQPCDFTMIRVYTWGAKRRRYETAYVESNLCGRLPIRVGKTATGDPEFRFNALASGKAAASSGYEERRYLMHQTIVRRVRAPVRR